MNITFPHLGNTYICIKAMLDDFKVDYTIPPFNNKRALELGTRHVPEMACLPLKINIGNYIMACEKGADTILMAGGCGPCRFGYYCEMHREIMKDLGYDLDIITLELTNGDFSELAGKIRRLSGGAGFFKTITAAMRTIRIARLVDRLEAKAFKIRPREMVRGDTGKIYNEFRNNVLHTKGSKEIIALINDTDRKMDRIEMSKIKPLKIGIVGEIYTTIEESSSFNLQTRLGEMGVEVDRRVTVGSWIMEHVVLRVLQTFIKPQYRRLAEPYLGKMIGGHAQETLGHSVKYALKGFDGIIQVFPLSCMPEIVAESILPAIEAKYGIPVLSLVIDEMTGEAGYMTRIEAFIDLLYKRREMKTENSKWLLSGR